ncbi:MAG: aminoglycoside phosphotransferase family protein [Spirochaetaceae bacterium]|nr:MAG: aminoglycoside phosphotransferase family protein [Spirochaetaceae bacterium]
MTTITQVQLMDLLATEYDMTARSVVPLGAGNDADANSFLVSTRDDARYLLRLRRGAAPEGALRALAEIASSGQPRLSAVVAPLPSRPGDFAVPVGPHTASLYPYVDGADAMKTGLSNGQWVELGAFVRALHDFEPTREVRSLLPVESFVPAWTATVWRLDAWALGHPDGEVDGEVDTATARFARFWRDRRGTIIDLLAAGERAGRVIRERTPRLVVCHADIHTANVLVPAAGPIRVVDWDGLLYAPPERDLMFVPDEHAAPFFRGYGPFDPDAQTIAYYRLEWAIQEIGDYGRRIVPPHGEVLEGRFRAAAFDEFIRLFDRDHEVEWAYEALARAATADRADR